MVEKGGLKEDPIEPLENMMPEGFSEEVGVVSPARMAKILICCQLVVRDFFFLSSFSSLYVCWCAPLQAAMKAVQSLLSFFKSWESCFDPIGPRLRLATLERENLDLIRKLEERDWELLEVPQR